MYLVGYCCMFKTSTLVYKFLCNGSPNCFGASLSLILSSTRYSYPHHRYLAILFSYSSLYKSIKHLEIMWPLMLLQFGLTSSIMYAMYLLPLSGKKLKHTCLQKPICPSHPTTPVSSRSKFKVWVLCPIQQPGSYWDRSSSALFLVKLKSTQK